MAPTNQIIICGKSVFSTAVEVLLAARPEFDVQRLHPRLPGVAESILARQPDVVIVEQSEATLILALLHHDVPLIELDPQNNKLRVLHRRSIAISGVDDLVSAVGQAAGELSDWLEQEH